MLRAIRLTGPTHTFDNWHRLEEAKHHAGIERSTYFQFLQPAREVP